MSAAPRLLIVETSGRVGHVALARGETLLRGQRLDEARRHARDLVPAVAQLLQAEGWRPRELDGVIVSRGPGSYTGLRVGIMSAKTVAYATGCRLIGVDTFAAIAAQTSGSHGQVDVIADAQQDKIYAQRFIQGTGDELRIVPFPSWLESLPPEVMVSGPGLEILASRPPFRARSQSFGSRCRRVCCDWAWRGIATGKATTFTPWSRSICDRVPRRRNGKSAKQGEPPGLSRRG